MSQIYRYELTVPEDAVDVNGHVNNLEYLRWMQDAAILHSDSQGCTKATTAAGATWVVRTHRVEYLRPAFAGEANYRFDLGIQLSPGPISAKIQNHSCQRQCRSCRRRN